MNRELCTSYPQFDCPPSSVYQIFKKLQLIPCPQGPASVLRHRFCLTYLSYVSPFLSYVSVLRITVLRRYLFIYLFIQIFFE